MLSSLSLVVPGLFGRPVFSPVVASSSLSALDQLMQHVIESTPAVSDFNQQLIALLSGQQSGDQQRRKAKPSLAYLLGKSYFNVEDPARYLIASPVHLQADSGRLLMHGQDGLDLGMDEVDQWLQELSPIFERHEIKIYSVLPEIWVLLLPETLKPSDQTFSDLEQVIGQDILDFMPNGENAMFWRSLINELQMQLHQSPVNSQRQVLKLKMVNSVWIGEMGQSVEFKGANWGSLCSDKAMVRALATSAGVGTLKSIASGDKVTDSVGDYHLVVDTTLAESAAREDLDYWYQSMQVLHDTVIVPVIDALQTGEVKEVQIYPINGKCYRIRQKRGLAQLIDNFRSKPSFADYMSDKH
ncbi:MAG: hypothetical protein COB61_003950 [Thiotrichales bacterium]|nr:hypothetical protein [Thiotrichales bacterium]